MCNQAFEMMKQDFHKLEQPFKIKDIYTSIMDELD